MQKLKKIIKFFIPVRYKEVKILAYYKTAKFFRKKNMIFLSEIFERKINKRYNCIISSKAKICDDLILPHPLGIVIGEGVIIEKNVTIYQNVTLGRKEMDKSKYPIIKENSVIYCNSTVLGNVIIERGTTIGANSLLMQNTEENSIYAGVPARKIK